MNDLFKNNKKEFFICFLAAIGLLLLLSFFTFAYFMEAGDRDFSKEIMVNSSTVDTLVFRVSNEIDFKVTPVYFSEGGINQSDDAIATVLLRPNNTNGSASAVYNIYLEILTNEIEYSSANVALHPELMVQVFDEDDNLVEITGLGPQKTIKGVTGYDITGKEGLYSLISNKEIVATNGEEKIDNWRIVITLINLNTEQHENLNKSFDANILFSREQYETDQTIIENYVYRNERKVLAIGDSIIPEDKYCIKTRFNNNFNTCDMYDSVSNYHFAEEMIFLTEWGIFDDKSSCEDYINGKVEWCLNIPELEYNSCDTFDNYDENVFYIFTTKESCEKFINYLVSYEYLLDASQAECLVGNENSFNTVFECTAGTINGIRRYNSNLDTFLNSTIYYTYLKHGIEDYTITSSEACLNQYDTELCIEGDYWVETGNGDENHASGENGLATLEKFKNEYFDVFRINEEDSDCQLSGDYLHCEFQYNDAQNGMLDCVYGSDYVECYVGSRFTVFFYSNNISGIGDGSSSCSILENESYCE